MNTDNVMKENPEDCRLKETAADRPNVKDYPGTETEGNKEKIIRNKQRKRRYIYRDKISEKVNIL